MSLAPLDWLLVAAYFALSFGIAIYYTKRAGQSTSEFFLGGRNMPWWLAGTSLVATTFAADTPLAVTEMVANNGIAGNWLWWNFAFGGMLTVFFFAKLWRRAGVLTDVEFVELRYSGRPAAVLRGLKAVYFGLFMNCIILGWVSLAMETVLTVLLPDITFFGQTSLNILGFQFSAALMYVAVLVLVVAVYSLMSGLWGVTVTDAFQFVIAMGGTTVLAFYVLDDPRIGGVSGLLDKLPASTFRMIPTLGDAAAGAGVLALSFAAFFAYVGVQWWSSWYPGAEPGGGGYVAQRLMSAKDERHSLFSALWFTMAHYCLRPWPWILVALSTIVLYPGLDTPRAGYVMAMREVLPTGLLGLLFAAFLAAFMSTVSSQLNWGVSYLVNDVWRRFIRPDENERYYVLVSRVATFVVALISIFVTTKLSSISGAWGLIITASAGLGLVLILRWYWWRINAYSELFATVTPIVIVVVLLIAQAMGAPLPAWIEVFPTNLFVIVALTTAVWLIVTFITRPTDPAVLDKFYRRVRPGGAGWKAVAGRNPDIVPDGHFGRLAVDWIVGVVLVYSTLFGVGNLIFHRTLAGILCIVAAVAAAAFLWRDLNRPESGPAAVYPDEAQTVRSGETV
ncbi:MAG TPA: sodium:solute symporter family protein [Rhodothermales bacterium]|nr:sodium:solute symporter family protein [Rhodothermales bacterium]